MRSPPAFQFYADDFIGGTCDLSASDVGAYIRLLCYQWSRGAIPDDPEKLDRVAGCKVSSDVLVKFPGGKNARMEAEREKQAAFREEQARKGKAGADARWKNGNGHAPAMATAMPQPCPGQWPNDGSPSPSPSPTKREREGGGSPVEPPKGFPASETEAVNLAAFVGCTEDFAKQVWNEAASRGGNDCFGEPVVNFRAYLAARAASDRSRKSERKTYSGSRGVIAKHTADSWK